MRWRGVNCSPAMPVWTNERLAYWVCAKALKRCAAVLDADSGREARAVGVAACGEVRGQDPDVTGLPGCVGAQRVDAIGLRLGARPAGQRVGQAAAIRSHADHVAVTEAARAVVLAHAAEFDRILGQVLTQQRGAGVIRLGQHLLAAERVRDHDLQLSSAGQHRQAIDRERARRHLFAGDRPAVHEDVHGGRHDGLALGREQRRRHEHRLRAEVRAELQAAETHGAAPRARRGDRVADAQRRHPVGKVAGPGRVETGGRPVRPRRSARPSCWSARPGCRTDPSSTKPPPWLRPATCSAETS